MSVTTVKLSSQGATGSASGDDASKVTKSYQSNYIVTCSRSEDAPSTVLNYFATHSSLPWFGRTFSFGNGFDATVKCKGVDAQYIEKSDGMFHVSCKFESISGDKEEQQQQGQTPGGANKNDPTLWHDEIEFSFANVTEVAEEAIFRTFENAGGNVYFKTDQKRAVTNSAGIPFDPPLEKDIAIRVIRISHNSKKCEAIKAARYLNAINNDSFTISKPAYGFSYPVGQYNAKIVSFNTSFAIENKVKYWRETIEVHNHPNGWRRRVLDQGTHRGQSAGNGDLFDTGTAISPSDEIAKNWTPYTAIKAPDGTPITTPVPLDGKGQPLKAGKPHVYLVYSVEKEMPFAGIKW